MKRFGLHSSPRFAMALACVSALLVACGPPEPRRMQDLALAERFVTLVPATAPASVTQSVSAIRTPQPEGVRVILVHGTPGDATGWVDYVLEPVPGTYSVALDRPGFGLSAPEGAVPGLAAQAAAVVSLFPEGTEKVILVGHSLGGAVVARVAAEHPQRVQALVLLASSLDPAQEAIHPLQPLGQMWPVKQMLPRMLRNANDELMAFKAELDGLQPLLARIQAPTLIVHGTQDDLVPFANVAYMQAQFTQAKCVTTQVLDGVNHFLPWNSEPAVRAAILWALRPDCGAT